MDFEWQAAFNAEMRSVPYANAVDGDRPWIVLKHIESNTNLAANLAFAVAFARDKNHTLACRALLSLALETKEDERHILATMTVFLAIEAGHIDCPNQCVRTVFRHPDETRQLDVLMQCIAFGIKSWPACPRLSVPSKIDSPPTTRSGIYEDLLLLVEKGYQAQEHQLMRAATILFLRGRTNLTLSRFPCTAGPSLRYFVKRGLLLESLSWILPLRRDGRKALRSP